MGEESSRFGGSEGAQNTNANHGLWEHTDMNKLEVKDLFLGLLENFEYISLFHILDSLSNIYSFNNVFCGKYPCYLEMHLEVFEMKMYDYQSLFQRIYQK